MIFGKFEWDLAKEEENIHKHELDFYTAALAFLDPHRVIAISEGGLPPSVSPGARIGFG